MPGHPPQAPPRRPTNERFDVRDAWIKPDFRGTPKAEDLHAELNKLGEQGCELVSALRTSLVEPTRRYPQGLNGDHRP